MAEEDWGGVPIKEDWGGVPLDEGSPSVTADIAKSAAIGVPKGAIGLAGLPSDVTEYGARGINWATQKIGQLTGLDVGPSRKPVEEPTLGGTHLRKAIENVTGPFY